MKRRCERCGERGMSRGSDGRWRCRQCHEQGRSVMPELRIPFAADNGGRLLSPTSADKGTEYHCPACLASVVLKRGMVRTAHFAHRASDICSQETIIHKTAKLLVQNAIRNWKLGKSGPPILRRVCEICEMTIDQPMPEKIDDAVLECRVDNGSVVDVALMAKDVAQAAVEIRVTHEVGTEKARSLPILFMELDGYEVIEDPLVWRPVKDQLKRLICGKCRSHYKAFQARAQRIARNSNIELPVNYYRYGICSCWRCRREIIAFAWPKSGAWDQSAPKEQPIPRTIQYRYSQTIRAEYWANTCPFCKSLQGDFFMESEAGSPLCGVPPGEDSSIAFENDMMTIAYRAGFRS